MTGEHGKVNGVVSWKSLTITVIAVFGVAGGLASWALSLHAQFPHKGAVSQQEYYNDMSDMKDDIKEIKGALKDIQRRL